MDNPVDPKPCQYDLFDLAAWDASDVRIVAAGLIQSRLAPNNNSQYCYYIHIVGIILTALVT